MYKKAFLRKIVMTLSVISLVVIMCGCSEIKLAGSMSSSTLLTLGDEECSVAEAIMYLMQVKEYYKADEDDIFWYRSIGDITLKDYIKDSAKDKVLRITASSLISTEMALYLTEDEISEIRTQATDAYDALKEKYDLEKYDITLETAIALYTKEAQYNKVYDKLSENINMQISEADTKVIKINYVDIPSSVSIDRVEELRSEIKSGTSFETACSSFGWEPVMNKVLKKGDISDAFENVAYALVDGELSEAVVNADHIYVIQCIEDYMITESVANNNEVLSNARQAAFDEYYNEIAERVEFRFNDKIWDSISVPDL